MPTDFFALSIRREISNALKDSGLTVATPVQEQAIPALMAGKDVIAQAQTGTGKTLAFVLPILEKIDAQKPYVQALIITPTRELALQITKEVQKLAHHVNASVLAAYGGQDVERQIKKLKGSTHIVIGTPGRLLDHLRRETIQLSGVSLLVLDEADQMLHMGFLTEVEEIISQTSANRQTMLFSATMPQPIRILAERYMRSPEDIRVTQNKRITLDEIKQIVVETSDREKQDTLCRMIDEYSPYLAIVFCRTKRRASTLNAALKEKGYDSDELHGDLSQAKREQVMKRFRDAKLQVLVATDVAARGLDVEGVTHVFNYDIPHDAESYIHRIGRTGRAGQTGIAITFASPRDRMDLQTIERGINTSIEKRTNDGQRIQVSQKKPSGRKFVRDERAPRRGGDKWESNRTRRQAGDSPRESGTARGSRKVGDTREARGDQAQAIQAGGNRSRRVSDGQVRQDRDGGQGRQDRFGTQARAYGGKPKPRSKAGGSRKASVRSGTPPKGRRGR